MKRALAIAFVFSGVLATAASAQIPARFYWKSLVGTKAVPVLGISLSGNANPLDPTHAVLANADLQASVAIGGYAQILEVFGRSGMVAVLMPMGRVSGEATVRNVDFSQSANGFGDPMLEFNVNLIGPPPIRNIPDMLRYEPGFSLDVIVDLTVPVGEYDNEQALNLGQNRWYGRVGAPIVWQLGPWVPGKRTTLEFLPSLWLFGNNTDFIGQTLETDPKWQVEGHLTRDFTEGLWGSLDGSWIAGGASTIDDLAGESLNMVGVGFTLGYHLNENLQLTTGYMATVGDGDPDDVRLGGFHFSLVYGWHSLIEGIGRLEGP